MNERQNSAQTLSHCQGHGGLLQPKPSIVYSLLVLGRSLGKGAYGSVCEARWGNQLCAAKLFLHSQSEFHQRAIQKETSILKNLRHRHIIQFYRIHQENGHIYLLMELAERGSLADAIKGKLLHDDWPTKIQIAREIAQGLAFIHKKGFLHCDIKSANVLLTKQMGVKLVDFGLAKSQSTDNSLPDSNHSGPRAVGTLRWIAPEILFSAKPNYSTKSDVYALGIVMWEMAAGCTRPFKHEKDDAAVALAVSKGTRETFPVNTPTHYRELAEKCWHENPLLRPEASQVAQIHDESTNEGAFGGHATTLGFTFTQSELRRPGA
ncbi:hypothetical protein DFQ26_004784 [Actinomortierella ambigua]|nr:hypothetical protein DFQ26_004784 [Actinomortierella ambigua]